MPPHISWTPDQIHFVLDMGKGPTAREISELFNVQFAGVATMSEGQVKYVRHRYQDNSRFQYVITRIFLCDGSITPSDPF